MRLTLRTLLAYIDDILDAESKQELAEKVETSEFAGDLIHRTKDTTRRLRLGAPQVVGAGIGLDPNTVAEYLDNTLPAENVADLERICLESDVHLAEVASCHHVLTMVLGEPAEIEPAMRKRMHGIHEEAEQRKRLRMEQAHPPAAAQTPAAAVQPTPAMQAAATADVTSSTVIEVPDYLRASRRSALSLVAKLAVAAAIIGVGAYFIWNAASKPDVVAEGQADQVVSDTGAANSDLTTEGPVVEQPAANDSAAPVGVDVPIGDAPPPAAIPQPAFTETEAESPQSPELPIKEQDASADLGPRYGGSEPGETADTVSEKTGDEPPMDNGPQLGVAIPPQPSASDPLIDGSPVLDEFGGVKPPLTSVPTAPTEGNLARTTPDLPISGTTLPTTSSTTPIEPAMTDNADESVEIDAAVETELPNEMGTFWADRSVLLRFDGERNDWFPLVSGTALDSGNRLLSLPFYRPTIALHSGLGVKPTGAAVVVLERTVHEDASQDVLELVYGRVLLVNTSDADNRIVIRVDDTEDVATLGPGAVLALEVERKWKPGVDPETTPAPVKAMAYSPTGDVLWEHDGQVLTAEQPSQWPFAVEQIPDLVPLSGSITWLEAPTGSRLDLMAAEDIRKRLQQPDMAASPILLELTENRKREVRAMAIHCGALVGQFAPSIIALRDSAQRANWPDHIETLRMAMALSPASASRVREALAEQRSESADDLFEMLRGYSRQEIGLNTTEMQVGALEKLINWLESDFLDYRVLAAHDLAEITGKNLLQNPSANLNTRRQGVQRWRQRLRDGELEVQEDYQG